ncbi:hypothetical protein NNJEOMEG_02574 [Fundidesulfovibrio magnetotacticus]|uniref:Uncharacterized protein n=2 Tax=Fundidesulfovibrio magnetotacticus TaxID=2730080 RepID=A0A6V8LYK3_9BACT|nr:hypothetical protein NNJEOMEG_02574 [Fundidesulfovibrio magnetotacticus]
MRAFGFINYEHVVGLSQECYDITDDDDIADEVMRWQEFTADHFRAEFYPARPFELCIADEDALMELSGIKDRRTFRRAIRTLENGRLIESLGDFVDGDHTWAVAVCGVLPSREECLAA